jgi:saccharopine dehydrogenase (NADP+, L-glutamate forming)
MKRVLVLGAGMVAGPLVDHLLAEPELVVEVADIIEDRARALVRGHDRGLARSINLDDDFSLDAAVKSSDLVVSLVPYNYHPVIAGHCIKHKKHLVTASYVGDAMRGLDGQAKKAGVVFLNEIGLDPGIDHMEAMRIIHKIRGRGGLVEEFVSYCGGLPAPEADTNPWGYKFSWSPLGVLRAGNNPAQYLRNGKKIVIPAERLFDDCPLIKTEGLPEFEGYPNRDSLQYIDLYGIPETRTMLRGTLRYRGWCRTIKAVRALGLLTDAQADWSGLSYEDFMRRAADTPAGVPVKKAVADKLLLSEDSDVIARFEWLGLFGQSRVGLAKGSPIEVLAVLMAERLKYAPGERDLVVLRHTFRATYPKAPAERIDSTLIDFGIPGGDSAMARTVGLPAAIGATLILRGSIRSAGVQIPVRPEIYEPVLSELAKNGIAFKEERATV